MAIHLCIGSIYSWSIFNPALVRELGVVTSAADDWSIESVVWIFSVAILFLGLTAAVAGSWLGEAGPRLTGVAAAVLWGGGFLVGALGVYLHQLWLLYLGYGVLGGCGLGLAYISPVAVLMSWFPDRRGLAGGLAITGFGGGAIIAVPLKEYLLRTFYAAPDYLGPMESVSLVTRQGRRFAEVSGQWVEVVVAGAADAANMIMPGPEGVYVVDTGSTGAASTFLVLGLLYFAVMFAASFFYRVPAAGWTPDGNGSATDEAAGGERDVPVRQAVRTPQFYLLWLVLCFNVTAGIGVIGVAKTMMTDIFGATLPGLVTPAFAATYVLMISVFNLGGRFGWAWLSDYLGRGKVFLVFTGVGAVLYLSIPVSAYFVGVHPAVVWLLMFYAATMLIFTMYGGGFACMPAYAADTFGAGHIGAIHGRLLTAWSTAGVIGPFVLTFFREQTIKLSINGFWRMDGLATRSIRRTSRGGSALPSRTSKS